ncbi:MAG TPA: hypothetical protein PK511_15360 [Chitinophagales bacterium]|nr:hypothetical protein [Chitinophagales bacterium]HMZ89896.1 hypothetical protein [Chitinophagales bacterium]HNF70691.1 hypothetical protein [Chitinophagales bacterium]HNI55904.1 hypothetical protein [Chitinophagales bacterium]HNJ90831.1 hypothetical protein [Chitinophagales bacterium]
MQLNIPGFIFMALLVFLVKKTSTDIPTVTDESQVLYRPSRSFGVLGMLLFFLGIVLFTLILLGELPSNGYTGAFFLTFFCISGLLLTYFRMAVYLKTTGEALIKRNIFKKEIIIPYKEIVSLSYNKNISALIVKTEVEYLFCFNNLIGFNFFIQTLEEATGLEAKGWMTR